MCQIHYFGIIIVIYQFSKPFVQSCIVVYEKLKNVHFKRHFKGQTIEVARPHSVYLCTFSPVLKIKI